jgi:hypothetical protein
MSAKILVGVYGFSGLKYFGLIWLARAVVLETDKRFYARSIREALQESPKKYRQAVARQFAGIMAIEKQARRKGGAL